MLAKYWRDAFGHRAMKDVDGSKTVYFNLGTAQLESYDVTATTASSTIYEPGIDRPLAEVSDSGAVTFYHQDWLGSVVLLTNSSGAKVQAYSYDVWGKVSGFDASGAPVTTTAVLSRFHSTPHESLFRKRGCTTTGRGNIRAGWGDLRRMIRLISQAGITIYCGMLLIILSIGLMLLDYRLAGLSAYRKM